MMNTGKKLLLSAAASVGLFGLISGALLAGGAMSVVGFVVCLAAVSVVAGVLVGVGFGILKRIPPVTEQLLSVAKERGLAASMPGKSEDEIVTLTAQLGALVTLSRQQEILLESRFDRARQSLKLTINTLPDAVAVLSDQGEIELANETAERLLGLNTGQHIDGLHMTWLSELFSKAVAEGTAVTVVHPAPLQVFDHGKERFFVPKAVPIKTAGGQLLGVTVVLADATPSHQLDEARSGLVSSVSHELKTPLTSIKMSIGLLLEDNMGPLTAQQRELLQAAAEDADRLHQMIQDLLDNARGRAARKQERHSIVAEGSREQLKG